MESSAIVGGVRVYRLTSARAILLSLTAARAAAAVRSKSG
jgi:hypothetical protein